MILCKILILFCFIQISLAYDCGVSGKPSGLIVNGKQSKRGAWPWLTVIFDIKTNKLMCGGSLVSSDTVITVRETAVVIVTFVFELIKNIFIGSTLYAGQATTASKTTN